MSGLEWMDGCGLCLSKQCRPGYGYTRACDGEPHGPVGGLDGFLRQSTRQLFSDGDWVVAHGVHHTLRYACDRNRPCVSTSIRGRESRSAPMDDTGVSSPWRLLVNDDDNSPRLDGDTQLGVPGLDASAVLDDLRNPESLVVGNSPEGDILGNLDWFSGARIHGNNAQLPYVYVGIIVCDQDLSDGDNVREHVRMRRVDVSLEDEDVDANALASKMRDAYRRLPGFSDAHWMAPVVTLKSLQTSVHWPVFDLQMMLDSIRANRAVYTSESHALCYTNPVRIPDVLRVTPDVYPGFMRVREFHPFYTVAVHASMVPALMFVQDARLCDQWTSDANSTLPTEWTEVPSPDEAVCTLWMCASRRLPWTTGAQLSLKATLSVGFGCNPPELPDPLSAKLTDMLNHFLVDHEIDHIVGVRVCMNHSSIRDAVTWTDTLFGAGFSNSPVADVLVTCAIHHESDVVLSLRAFSVRAKRPAVPYAFRIHTPATANSRRKRGVESSLEAVIGVNNKSGDQREGRDGRAGLIVQGAKSWHHVLMSGHEGRTRIEFADICVRLMEWIGVNDAQEFYGSTPSFFMHTLSTFNPPTNDQEWKRNVAIIMSTVPSRTAIMTQEVVGAYAALSDKVGTIGTEAVICSQTDGSDPIYGIPIKFLCTRYLAAVFTMSWPHLCLWMDHRRTRVVHVTVSVYERLHEGRQYYRQTLAFELAANAAPRFFALMRPVQAGDRHWRVQSGFEGASSLTELEFPVSVNLWDCVWFDDTRGVITAAWRQPRITADGANNTRPHGVSPFSKPINDNDVEHTFRAVSHARTQPLEISRQPQQSFDVRVYGHMRGRAFPGSHARDTRDGTGLVVAFLRMCRGMSVCDVACKMRQWLDGSVDRADAAMARLCMWYERIPGERPIFELPPDDKCHLYLQSIAERCVNRRVNLVKVLGSTRVDRVDTPSADPPYDTIVCDGAPPGSQCGSAWPANRIEAMVYFIGGASFSRPTGGEASDVFTPVHPELAPLPPPTREQMEMIVTRCFEGVVIRPHVSSSVRPGRKRPPVVQTAPPDAVANREAGAGSEAHPSWLEVSDVLDDAAREPVGVHHSPPDWSVAVDHMHPILFPSTGGLESPIGAMAEEADGGPGVMSALGIIVTTPDAAAASSTPVAVISTDVPATTPVATATVTPVAVIPADAAADAKGAADAAAKSAADAAAKSAAKDATDAADHVRVTITQTTLAKINTASIKEKGVSAKEADRLFNVVCKAANTAKVHADEATKSSRAVYAAFDVVRAAAKDTQLDTDVTEARKKSAASAEEAIDAFTEAAHHAADAAKTAAGIAAAEAKEAAGEINRLKTVSLTAPLTGVRRTAANDARNAATVASELSKHANAYVAAARDLWSGRDLSSTARTTIDEAAQSAKEAEDAARTAKSDSNDAHLAAYGSTHAATGAAPKAADNVDKAGAGTGTGLLDVFSGVFGPAPEPTPGSEEKNGYGMDDEDAKRKSDELMSASIPHFIIGSGVDGTDGRSTSAVLPPIGGGKTGGNGDVAPFVVPTVAFNFEQGGPVSSAGPFADPRGHPASFSVGGVPHSTTARAGAARRASSVSQSVSSFRFPSCHTSFTHSKTSPNPHDSVRPIVTASDVLEIDSSVISNALRTMESNFDNAVRDDKYEIYFDSNSAWIDVSSYDALIERNMRVLTAAFCITRGIFSGSEVQTGRVFCLTVTEVIRRCFQFAQTFKGKPADRVYAAECVAFPLMFDVFKAKKFDANGMQGSNAKLRDHLDKIAMLLGNDAIDSPIDTAMRSRLNLKLSTAMSADLETIIHSVYNGADWTGGDGKLMELVKEVHDTIKGWTPAASRPANHALRPIFWGRMTKQKGNNIAPKWAGAVQYLLSNPCKYMVSTGTKNVSLRPLPGDIIFLVAALDPHKVPCVDDVLPYFRSSHHAMGNPPHAENNTVTVVPRSVRACINLSVVPLAWGRLSAHVFEKLKVVLNIMATEEERKRMGGTNADVYALEYEPTLERKDGVDAAINAIATLSLFWHVHNRMESMANPRTDASSSGIVRANSIPAVPGTSMQLKRAMVAWRPSPAVFVSAFGNDIGHGTFIIPSGVHFVSEVTRRVMTNRAFLEQCMSDDKFNAFVSKVSTHWLAMYLLETSGGVEWANDRCLDPDMALHEAWIISCNLAKQEFFRDTCLKVLDMQKSKSVTSRYPDVSARVAHPPVRALVTHTDQHPRFFKFDVEYTRAVITGLRNPGVLCYLNTAIQILAHMQMLLGIPEQWDINSLVDTLDSDGTRQILAYAQHYLESGQLEEGAFSVTATTKVSGGMEDVGTVLDTILGKMNERALAKGVQRLGILDQDVTACVACGYIRDVLFGPLRLQLGVDDPEHLPLEENMAPRGAIKDFTCTSCRRNDTTHMVRRQMHGGSVMLLVNNVVSSDTIAPHVKWKCAWLRKGIERATDLRYTSIAMSIRTGGMNINGGHYVTILRPSLSQSDEDWVHIDDHSTRQLEDDTRVRGNVRTSVVVSPVHEEERQKAFRVYLFNPDTARDFWDTDMGKLLLKAWGTGSAASEAYGVALRPDGGHQTRNAWVDASSSQTYDAWVDVTFTSPHALRVSVFMLGSRADYYFQGTRDPSERCNTNHTPVPMFALPCMVAHVIRLYAECIVPLKVTKHPRVEFVTIAGWRRNDDNARVFWERLCYAEYTRLHAQSGMADTSTPRHARDILRCDIYGQ